MSYFNTNTYFIMKKLFTLLFFAASTATVSAQSSIANGAVCPNITITDTKGVAHKLYDYCNAGKYVVIDFFAYWCGPCKATAPTIVELYKKYGCNSGNLIVLGNESDPAGTLADLHSFDASAGIDTNNSYPSTYGIIGGGANGTTYGVSAYPTIILIGPDKKMINNDIWPISSMADIEAKFPTGSGISPKACAAPTAVASVKNENLQVVLSPNPVNDQLTIQSEQLVSVTIMNQIGSVLQSVKLNEVDQTSIDVSSLSQGIYLVEVKTSKGTSVKKFSRN